MKQFLNKITTFIGTNYIQLIYGLSLLAMLISLYFSEVAQLEACTLCWYQRICMYPIAVISFIAMLRKDKYVYRYILPLAVAGALLALYNYLLQKAGFNLNILTCSTGKSCADIDFELLGFITIPLMSLVAFLGIIVAAWLGRRKTKQ